MKLLREVYHSLTQQGNNLIWPKSGFDLALGRSRVRLAGNTEHPLCTGKEELHFFLSLSREKMHTNKRTEAAARVFELMAGPRSIFCLDAENGFLD